MTNLSRSKALGIKPLDELPTTIQKCAWSSPIRYMTSDPVEVSATVLDPAAAT